MNERYTREDVIIWADDPRAQEAIGKECFIEDNPRRVLEKANQNTPCRVLTGIRTSDEPYPFMTRGGFEYACIIVKKEPEKKLVPFDLSKKEDRDALMGKRIISKPENKEKDDMLITYFFEWEDEDCTPEWVIQNCINGLELFHDYIFADTGLPVGKEVEDDEQRD